MNYIIQFVKCLSYFDIVCATTSASNVDIRK